MNLRLRQLQKETSVFFCFSKIRRNFEPKTRLLTTRLHFKKRESLERIVPGTDAEF